MIRLIDQQYVDRSPSKRSGRGQSAETTADDNNQWTLSRHSFAPAGSLDRRMRPTLLSASVVIGESRQSLHCHRSSRIAAQQSHVPVIGLEGMQSTTRRHFTSVLSTNRMHRNGNIPQSRSNSTIDILVETYYKICVSVALA